MAQPTYKVMIRLLEQAEAQAGPQLSVAEALTVNFSELYPHIEIARPGRFLETVKRISAPVKSGTLKKSDRRSYLERCWAPRIRNLTFKGM